MSTFADSAEVHRRIGGILRQAGAHPGVGPQLAALDLVLQLRLEDPAARITACFREPVTVLDDHEDPEADITLTMAADLADRFWRGEYNLAVGLARDRIEVTGSVDRLLTIVPLLRPLFPTYRTGN